MAEKGHVCVNGGGKFGGMGALNKSCKEAGGKVRCFEPTDRSSCPDLSSASPLCVGQVVAIIHEMWVDLELFEDADEQIVCSVSD